jgi:SNF family Na+-dependent transporter
MKLCFLLALAGLAIGLAATDLFPRLRNGAPGHHLNVSYDPSS